MVDFIIKMMIVTACPGNGVNAPSANQPSKPKKKTQEQPVYNIPEGTSPEEAKKMKKRMKRERQKLRKEQEKLEAQQMEQMKQLEIQKRQEFLKQQEAHIRKQQAALEREQQALLRQQTKGQSDQGKKNTKKGKANNVKSKESSKGKNVSALVYDGDDVARNFSLPPGVSINKVAGQPGMVTISNNMGNPFPQPFLPNPNLYQNNILSGYPVGSHGNNSGYPLRSSGYSGVYGGCGGPVPWNGGIDPCTGTPQESVIVVDTNAGTTSAKGLETHKSGTSHRHKKKVEEMTPEEKINAAVRGELDVAYLNQTQKKKYTRCLKAIQLEEEMALQKQREEDAKEEFAKNKSGKKNSKGKDTSHQKNTNVHHAGTNASNHKQTQQTKNDKNLTKKQKQNNSHVSNKVVSNQTPSKGKTNLSNNNAKKGSENKISSKSESKVQDSRLQQNHQTQSKGKNKHQQQQANSHQQHSQKQQQQKGHQNQQKQQQQKSTQGNQQKQQPKNSQNSQTKQPQQQSSKKNQKGAPQQQTQAEHAQGKQSQSQAKKQKQANMHHTQDKKQSNINSLSNSDFNAMRLQSTYKGDTSNIYSAQMPYEVGSYGPSIGYANNDYGHEARYAQYLAANASTLASMEYETSNLKSQHSLIGEENIRKKGKKRGKKGRLEDLQTIDSVFTPKELPSGELDDETDREVEAFKRFCLYNVPRNVGEKPKVNFNVKDIMIKKKH